MNLFLAGVFLGRENLPLTCAVGFLGRALFCDLGGSNIRELFLLLIFLLGPGGQIFF